MCNTAAFRNETKNENAIFGLVTSGLARTASTSKNESRRRSWPTKFQMSAPCAAPAKAHAQLKPLALATANMSSTKQLAQTVALAKQPAQWKQFLLPNLNSGARRSLDGNIGAFFIPVSATN
jgi:hypothetical protein